jgi:hypothetical protein
MPGSKVAVGQPLCQAALTEQPLWCGCSYTTYSVVGSSYRIASVVGSSSRSAAVLGSSQRTASVEEFDLISKFPLFLQKNILHTLYFISYKMYCS